MKYAEAAQKAMEQTRAFYKTGPKSANKLYDVSKTPVHLQSRAKARNTALVEANKQLKETRAIELKVTKTKLTQLKPIEYGSILANLGMNAVNCGELTAIACYYAYKLLGRPSLTHEASLTPPGDHAFCIVGDVRGYPIAGSKVSELARLSLVGGEEPWVVDAWANVCCAISDYPELMEAKAKKWTADGKRVAWMGKDMKSPGWYPPSGDYSSVFLDSKIVLTVGA